MAKNGIDVWGIDWRWATIPFDPANPMANAPIPDTGDPGITHLNTKTHLDDFETTLKIARQTRELTGQGKDKVYVTGWSRGAYMTISLACRQAGYSPESRDIAGIIPIDFCYNSDDPVLINLG